MARYLDARIPYEKVGIIDLSLHWSSYPDIKLPMKLLGFTVLFTLACVLNAGALYYHQYSSETWLPRTEGGKMRYGLVELWIEGAKDEYAKDIGYSDFESLPSGQKIHAVAFADERYPSSIRKRIKARNHFRSYLEGFGMWQWPLSIISTILAITVIFNDKRRFLKPGIGMTTLNIILFIDATYRSYFGALGW